MCRDQRDSGHQPAGKSLQQRLWRFVHFLVFAVSSVSAFYPACFPGRLSSTQQAVPWGETLWVRWAGRLPGSILQGGREAKGQQSEGPEEPVCLRWRTLGLRVVCSCSEVPVSSCSLSEGLGWDPVGSSYPWLKCRLQ